MNKVVLEEFKKLILKNAKNNKISDDSFFDIVNSISEKYKLNEDFLDKAIAIVSSIDVEFDENEKEDYPNLKVDEDGYSDDIVASYLKAISKIPLLTENEELDLAINFDNAFDEKERKSLKDKFIKHNLKLVVSVAKKYGHCCSTALDFMDMIQEGNIGLGKAVDKYDYRKGYKFSTYATWWIRQAITRSIADTSKTVRIPVHVHEKVRKLYKIIGEFLADEEKVSDEKLADILGWTVEQVRFYKRAGEDTVSLSTPVNEEEDSELGSFIADDAFSIHEEVERNALRDSLEGALSILNPREKMVVKYRFGLHDGKVYTLEEISKMPEYNLTRERVRQIEGRALAKIRKNPAILRELAVYLQDDSCERSGYIR